MDTKSQQPTDFKLGAVSNIQTRKFIFVTNKTILHQTFSQVEINEFDSIIELLKNGGHIFCDLSSCIVDEYVNHFYNTRDDAIAVIIIGNHSIVPSKKISTITKELRKKIDDRNDEFPNSRIIDQIDDFKIWSDDLYGQKNSSSIQGSTIDLPYYPVSRIPFNDFILIKKCLMLSKTLEMIFDTSVYKSALIRNIDRAYSDLTFSNAISKDGNIWISPTVFGGNESKLSLKEECLYIVLHGSYKNGKKFFGGSSDKNYDYILKVSEISREMTRIIFCSCCWGALTFDRDDNYNFIFRTVKNSIALKFLSLSARAFIGSTGLHYSPTSLEQGVDKFGSRLHFHFWKSMQSGASPAQALLEAKILFSQDLQDPSDDLLSAALEQKTQWSFTCLGLGW